MKLQTGLLSCTNGSLARLTAVKMHGKNFLRSRIMPHPLQSQAAVDQANRVAACAYYIPFFRLHVMMIGNTMPDFWRDYSSNFIRYNVALFDSPVNWSSLKFSWGKLFPVRTGNFYFDSGFWYVDVDSSDGNNGSPYDVYAIFVFRPSTLSFPYALQFNLRNAGGQYKLCQVLLSGDILGVYTFRYDSIRLIGTILSDSFVLVKE